MIRSQILETVKAAAQPRTKADDGAATRNPGEAS